MKIYLSVLILTFICQPAVAYYACETPSMYSSGMVFKSVENPPDRGAGVYCCALAYDNTWSQNCWRLSNVKASNAEIHYPVGQKGGVATNQNTGGHGGVWNFNNSNQDESYSPSNEESSYSSPDYECPEGGCALSGK